MGKETENGVEGRKFKQGRVAKGLLVKQVAAESGMARETYGRIEAGKQRPIPAARRRLCEILDLDPDTLEPIAD